MSTLTAPEGTLLKRLWHLPHAAGLALSVFMLGFGVSLAAPYLPLYAVKSVHMTPLQLGLFLTLNAVGAVLISTRLARWSDRRTSRKPLLLLTLAAGVAAYGLISVLHTFAAVLVTGMLLMGTAAAAFPQMFAFSRMTLMDAPGELPEKAVTVLRSVFSLAWVVGPGLGALLLNMWSFQGVFLGAALCFMLAALPLLRVPEGAPRPQTAQQVKPERGAPHRLLVWVALAFTLYGMSLHMGMGMFPLLVTQTLHGTEGQVGFLVGLCALLEIPAMLALVTLRGLPSTEKLVKLAFFLFALHFAVLVLASSMPLLVVAQVLRAAVLAVTAGLGMLFFQELMPGRIAAATTLFSNTTAVGGMLAGIVSGACAQWFGYRAVYVVCAVLALFAWVVMQFMVKRRSEGLSV